MRSLRHHCRRLVDAVLVGNRWRTFCGCSHPTFLEALTGALEDAAVAFEIETRTDARDRATAGVCLVDVSPIPDDHGAELAALMQAVTAALESAPWDLAGHPRFRFALLHRYKIRSKWHYWLRNDSAVDTRHVHRDTHEG
ncbi:hypothetical protein D8Y22_21460 [Salinadaptatus halalkaliphilus]|uniref:Uncharacterized protein n=1 Tax=Salinadaptatus halalkaliphilus TaxID=2419781 RepID=A0A4S3TIH1_9EURY|nr:hypothetical protein [Salinadaptatus halalkaliphilus]THE63013.1 hypothetical protein D8Y22_21460 [Salinadaptatus halalkaliphilus]